MIHEFLAGPYLLFEEDEAMTLTTYLYFEGNCREAFEFYAAALAGEIEMMMPYSAAPHPMPVAEEWKDKVMHVTLRIGAEGSDGMQRLQGSDAPPGQGGGAGQGFSVSVTVAAVAEAERIFGLLGDGGVEIMAMQETFWAPRFGMVRDRFGVPWMVSAHVPQG